MLIRRHIDQQLTALTFDKKSEPYSKLLLKMCKSNFYLIQNRAVTEQDSLSQQLGEKY